MRYDEDSSSVLRPAAGERGLGLGWYSDGGAYMHETAEADEFHDCRGPPRNDDEEDPLMRGPLELSRLRPLSPQKARNSRLSSHSSCSSYPSFAWSPF